jgi:hypothetical protein
LQRPFIRLIPVCTNVLALTKRYWELAYDISAAPGRLGTVLLGHLVIAKKSLYPRWTLIANPGVALLILTGAIYLPSPFGAILVCGTTNLSIATFFAASIWTTRLPRY